MLVGGLPYRADDALSMAIPACAEPVPRLPPALRHWQRFFDRALAKSPRKRFADAAQMLSGTRAHPLGGRAASIRSGWPGSPPACAGTGHGLD